MQSTLLNAAALFDPEESLETDITEALPSGVVTVKDFREAVQFLTEHGVEAVVDQ